MLNVSEALRLLRRQSPPKSPSSSSSKCCGCAILATAGSGGGRPHASPTRTSARCPTRCGGDGTSNAFETRRRRRRRDDCWSG